ncbi:MAG TPA: isoprenylcysteine carboxylmethyltransferase family protein [Caldimonas sp.]|nr:isoprenylcysteine carboxylmethyltransferase family protein [Caldimonas sp.]
MTDPHGWLLGAMWIAWAAYWWATASNVKPAVRREGLVSRALHIVPLGAAVLLLLPGSVAGPVLAGRFVPRGEMAYWAGAAVTLCGLLFAMQARHRLGRNWSGTVTVKQDHELVTDGPYGIVRHPIYSGLLAAFIGSALALGEWRGILSVALVLIAFARKIRLEERWMQERFGDAYVRYRQHVPALLPRFPPPGPRDRGTRP